MEDYYLDYINNSKNIKQNNPFKSWTWYWNRILKRKKKIKKWLRNIFLKKTVRCP